MAMRTITIKITRIDLRAVVLALLVFAHGAASATIAVPAQSVRCEVDLAPRAWLKAVGGLFPGPASSPRTSPSVTIKRPSRKQAKKGVAFAVERIDGSPWYSSASPEKAFLAIQGDPRTVLVLLGAEVARVLGYSMTDAGTVLIPTVARLNQGIEWLNGELRPDQRINLSFFEQTDMDDLRYLEKIAERKFPVSVSDDRVALHDHNFHVAILAALPSQIDRMAFVTREIIRPMYAIGTTALGSGAANFHNLLISGVDVSLAHWTHILSLIGGREERASPLRRDYSTIYSAIGAVFSGASTVGEFMWFLGNASESGIAFKELLHDRPMLADRILAFEYHEDGPLLTAGLHTGRAQFHAYMARRRQLLRAARSVLAKTNGLGPLGERP